MAKLKKLNKKGIYFTLITILMMSVFLVSFSSRTYVPQKEDLPAVQTRVQIANDYVKNLDDIYIERALYISSYWALEALVLYENKTGSFFSSREQFEQKFAEVMLNGSINGFDLYTVKGIDVMVNNTLIHKLGQIENASFEAFDITTNFTKTPGSFKVKIWQSNLTGPWQVAVNITMNVVVDADLVRWNQTLTAQTIFNIDGLNDPIYMVRTYGMHPRRIEKTHFQQWNVTNLYEHIKNGTYNADSHAPSFLGRFYNNLSASSCCGIESAINPNEMFMPDTPKTYIDWCLFSTKCPPDVQGRLWKIPRITSPTQAEEFYAFKLDDYHIVLYNVTEEAYIIP